MEEFNAGALMCPFILANLNGFFSSQTKEKSSNCLTQPTKLPFMLIGGLVTMLLVHRSVIVILVQFIVVLMDRKLTINHTNICFK